METFIDRLILIINTFGGSGLISKKMPGTVGSAIATIISYFIPNHSSFLFFNIAVFLFIIGTLTCQKYVLKHPNDLDPKYIVIDEACAIFLGNAIVLMLIEFKWYLYILLFIFFRIFDIWKPYPINNLEKYCKQKKTLLGFGIMIDDIVAVIPAVLCVYIVYYFSIL